MTRIAINGFGGIEPLARHLRIIHSWDRVGLERYGQKVGIDFDVVYSSIQELYEFAPEEQQNHCDECDWKPDPEKERPDSALRLHKKTHRPLEVETIG